MKIASMVLSLFFLSKQHKRINYIILIDRFSSLACDIRILDN